jgi:hypothetical protein
MSSFSAHAADVACEASAPARMNAGISICISSSPLAPEGMASGNIASRLAVTTSR